MELWDEGAGRGGGGGGAVRREGRAEIYRRAAGYRPCR